MKIVYHNIIHVSVKEWINFSSRASPGKANQGSKCVSNYAGPLQLQNYSKLHKFTQKLTKIYNITQNYTYLHRNIQTKQKYTKLNKITTTVTLYKKFPTPQ